MDALKDSKLITLVNALNVDDFGNRDEWVAAYVDFNLGGREQQIPARWSRKERVLRVAAKSPGF